MRKGKKINICKGSSRRGMIVPFVITMMAILIIFLFSYSRSLSSHQTQMKRIQVGAMCANLAIGCSNVVAQVMEKETQSIYKELSTGHLSRFSYLISRRLGVGEKANIQVPASYFQKYERMVEEMVQSVNLEGYTFRFDGLNVFFEDVTSMFLSGDPLFEYQDFLEKRGYLTVEVKVTSIQDKRVSKSARIKRPFKVVNLLPPIHSRFSLFIAHTPQADTYNVVSYHPTNGCDPTPLTLVNNPVPMTYSSPPNLAPDELDLQLNGWVYLGPTDDPVDDGVYLNMAEGYTNPFGQMMLFGKDPQGAIIRFSAGSPAGLRHWLNPPGFPVLFFHRFEGISSQKQVQYNAQGIFNLSLPPFVSWLQLYGNVDSMGRTLIGGPVYGRVLKFMEMGPYGWKPDGSDNVKPLNDNNAGEATIHAWNNKLLVPRTPPAFGSQLPSTIYELYRRDRRPAADKTNIPAKWGDIFTDPTKYESYCSTILRIPFNQFFDLVKHPVPPTLNLPSWFFLPLDPNDSSYITQDSIRGLIRTVSQVPAGQNAYLAKDLMTFGYSQGVSKPFFRFAGDLRKFKTRDLIPPLYEGRVTMQVNLVGGSPSEEADSLQRRLLVNGKILAQSGIILVNRDPRNAQPAPLPLPTNLIGVTNSVLVFDKGDVLVDGILTQARDRHLTVVLLAGSFQVTEKLIQAYLVAMKPGSSSAPPGRLISRDGKTLNIDGGVAVQELGIPLQGDDWSKFFKDGGKIRYNHTFNPCNYWFEDYYGLFVADSSPFIEVVEQ